VKHAVEENIPTLQNHYLVNSALLDEKILTMPLLLKSMIHFRIVQIVPATRTILTQVKIVFFAQWIHWTVLLNVVINAMLVNLKQQQSTIPLLRLNARNAQLGFSRIVKMYPIVQYALVDSIRMKSLHLIVRIVQKASMEMTQLNHL